MNRLHLTLIAGLLAAAAVLGTVAATHTVSLGAAHTKAASTNVVVRTKQLQRFEASLRPCAREEAAGAAHRSIGVGGATGRRPSDFAPGDLPTAARDRGRPSHPPR